MKVIDDRVDKERLLSIDEVAYRLNLSHWTIRDWLKRGYILSHKLGSRRMIPESEIDRLMRASKRPAKHPIAFA